MSCWYGISSSVYAVSREPRKRASSADVRTLPQCGCDRATKASFCPSDMACWIVDQNSSWRGAAVAEDDAVSAGSGSTQHVERSSAKIRAALTAESLARLGRGCTIRRRAIVV